MSVKLNNILNGWYNFIKKSEVTEKIAEQRAIHCLSCVELKEGVLLSFLNDELEEIQGYKCGVCNCPLSAKLRSKNEKCPQKKW